MTTEIPNQVAGPGAVLRTKSVDCRRSAEPSRNRSEAWGIVPDVGRRGEVPLSAALSSARVSGAVLVCRARRTGAHAVSGDPVHGSGQLHPQHSAARTWRSRLEWCGGGLRCGDADRPARDRVDRGGAGATSMCADLGSRTIRDEIDALEVLGINPFSGWLRRVCSRRVWSPCY